MLLNASFMMLIILYIVALECGVIGTKSENDLQFRHYVKVLK